jgi:RecJ-like exonuclease
MTKQLSFEAEKIWRAIQKSHQQSILNSVWCGQCRGSTTIMDYSAQMAGNSLVLIGKCQVCGKEVRRLVD